jgi:hypothetical protein
MTSRGLVAFRDYLRDYARGASFTSLMNETSELKHDLAELRYSVLVKDGGFTVNHYEAETDYSAEILTWSVTGGKALAPCHERLRLKTTRSDHSGHRLYPLRRVAGRTASSETPRRR